mgnify:CR=1 FL=1
MKEKNDLKFEEALARLEAIVAEMESGKLGLEDSMKKFEEGMKLARVCAARLGEAEKKVEILVRKAENVLEWQPFDEKPGPKDTTEDEDDDGSN